MAGDATRHEGIAIAGFEGRPAMACVRAGWGAGWAPAHRSEPAAFLAGPPVRAASSSVNEFQDLE